MTCYYLNVKFQGQRVKTKRNLKYFGGLSNSISCLLFLACNYSNLAYLSGYHEYHKAYVTYWVVEDVILKRNVTLLSEHSLRKTTREFLKQQTAD